MRRLWHLAVVGFVVFSPIGTLGKEDTAGDSPAKTLSSLRVEAAKAVNSGDSRHAIDLLTQVLKQDAKNVQAYRTRGREQFRIGNIAESVADFDRTVELAPAIERQLWERGISHYYLGKYDDGARQFELYQTYHDNDVENSAWRYLCMARSVGVEKARKAMLPIRNDRRVPMMEIFDLYRGKATPEAVMAAVRAGNPGKGDLNRRLGYAHLYLGLYYEVAGKSRLAREHIFAAEQHRWGHYMWDVARVHAERLRQQDSKEAAKEKGTDREQTNTQAD